MLSLVIDVVIGAIIGYLGPFGSVGLPLLERVIYWIILVLLGHFVYLTIDQLISKMCIKIIHSKQLLFMFSSLVSALILSLCVELISTYFLNLPQPFQYNFMNFFPKVFVLGVFLHSIGYIYQKSTKTNLTDNENNRVAENFLKRLPNNLGNDLICFHMQDIIYIFTQT